MLLWMWASSSRELRFINNVKVETRPTRKTTAALAVEMDRRINLLLILMRIETYHCLRSRCILWKEAISKIKRVGKSRVELARIKSKRELLK